MSMTNEATPEAVDPRVEDAAPAVSPWVRVRNVALEYVGIGWFLTQVAGVAFRQLGLPPNYGDYLVILLGAGFVVAVGASTVLAHRAAATGRRFGRRGSLLLAGAAALAAIVIWMASGGQAAVRAGSTGLVQEKRGLFATSNDIEGFFVVHPQEPFTATGITVRRGQAVAIEADGRVNISVTRIVEAADAGDEAAYDWVTAAGEVDAGGQAVRRVDRGRPGRERCLVNSAYPYGALLLLIAPTDRVTTTTARGMEPDREIFAVGDDLEVTVEDGGELVLALNDVYLDDPACDPAAFASGRDPSAFYRDNIGFFTTRIRVR